MFARGGVGTKHPLAEHPQTDKKISPCPKIFFLDKLDQKYKRQIGAEFQALSSGKLFFEFRIKSF